MDFKLTRMDLARMDLARMDLARMDLAQRERKRELAMCKPRSSCEGGRGTGAHGAQLGARRLEAHRDPPSILECGMQRHQKCCSNENSVDRRGIHKYLVLERSSALFSISM
jgi:hypothetical protein